MKLLLNLGAMLVLCGGLHAAPPLELNVAQFAFNFGSSDQDKIDDATANKVYEDVPTPNNSHVVRYVRLETFENSKVTTRAQETLFCYGEATYCPTLPDGMRLCTVTLSYVILDYQGRLQAGAKSWQLSLNALQPAKSVTTPGPGAKKFYQSLPPWARAQLHLVSGYLEKNPGRPVIAYTPPASEILGSIFGGVMTLAPSTGWLAGALGEVVENVVKTIGLQAFKNALQSGELRRGFDYRVRDESILKYKAVYETSGVKMWRFALE